MKPKIKITQRQAAMAACYVSLYDLLCEIVTAIHDDPECDRELKTLARKGRKVLDDAKARVPDLS